ncbi:MAG TPA: GAF domain-containing SpoIIE family protein phosphatase [Pseudacidobacterium sp.]|jgi:sigma-B regulation protein RsbU (phosphoserine phosphatase)|nr:GAF domain-containing SpoIIE family protein phosphatase [Pseudacidobacterium sp.]
MAAPAQVEGTFSSFPAHIHSSCEFVQALMKLQRAAQLISSTLDLDVLLDRVTNDLANAIGNCKVSVSLREAETNEMVICGVHGVTQKTKGMRLKIGYEGIVGHVAATGKMYYAPDTRVDPYYIACEPGMLSEICLPLLSRGQVVGVFAVDHHETNAFSEDQIQVFQALAAHISIAIENARIFQQERMERERMQREADEARLIQQSLFLKAVPLVCGFSFETAWHPAGAVAGDWFDFIDLGDERYGIVLADVSGKGMAAALLMSATRAILRSLAKLHRSPSETLVHLNQTLIEDFPSGKFVTMIYGILDARTREITIASAGHLRPLLINGHGSFLNVDTGLPLGLGASSYPEHRIELAAGTQLLFYSDGITEAVNHLDEEFGPARLVEHFSEPDACVESLIEKIRRFGFGSDLTDDATALLIRSRSISN